MYHFLQKEINMESELEKASKVTGGHLYRVRLRTVFIFFLLFISFTDMASKYYKMKMH